MSARAEADRAAGEWEAARKAADAASVGAEEAGHRLHEHRARLVRAERIDLAAVLRPTLRAGDECPVCAQAVATLPPPLDGADLDALRKAVAEAEAASRAAVQNSGAAEAAQVTARRAADRARAAVVGLESALDGRPSEADAARLLAELDDRARAAETAADAARTARRKRDGAAARVDELRAALSGAETELRRSRDPLVGLGAPDPGEDVAAGWRALVGWAAAEMAAREGRAATVRESLARAESDETAARGELETARAGWAAARAAESAALRAEQQVVAEIDAADRRRAALDAALAGLPDDAEAEAGIARAGELAAAAHAADLAARRARDALREEEAAAGGIEAELVRAWDEVRRVRDPLVGLGAPRSSATTWPPPGRPSPAGRSRPPRTGPRGVPRRPPQWRGPPSGGRPGRAGRRRARGGGAPGRGIR
ncbi:hypothetical protein [Pseudonocardia xishanensis]|uniref:Exonuclease SbcC n=1 Tax=Pseudonocardia xishanensis TaxID=630995 RepID=A0ABP8RVS7_9PSEU